MPTRSSEPVITDGSLERPHTFTSFARLTSRRHHDDEPTGPTNLAIDRSSDRTNLLFTMSNQHAARDHWRSRRRNFIYGRVATPEAHDQETWWSQTGSNRRPHACKARALPTELWPHVSTDRCARRWWARKDLNFRPHAYQARALTS